LPHSNEKVVSLTGPPNAIGVAVQTICQIIIDEPAMGQQVFPYNPQSQPTGFFNQRGHYQGFGNSGFGNFGGMPGGGFGKGSRNTNSRPHEQVPGWQFEINNGWGDYDAPEAVDKFLQKVKASDIVEEEVQDGEGEDAKQIKTASSTVTVNIHQFNIIVGFQDLRLKEVKDISLCDVAYDDEIDEDSCMREIEITAKGANAKQQVENAIWLMNCCVNAFSDVHTNVVRVKPGTTLEKVVTSEAFGLPPGVKRPKKQAHQMKRPDFGGLNMGTMGGGMGNMGQGMQGGRGGGHQGGMNNHMQMQNQMMMQQQMMQQQMMGGGGGGFGPMRGGFRGGFRGGRGNFRGRGGGPRQW